MKNHHDAHAAKHFFQKALQAAGHPRPSVINVDGNPLYPNVITRTEAAWRRFIHPATVIRTNRKGSRTAGISLIYYPPARNAGPQQRIFDKIGFSGHTASRTFTGSSHNAACGKNSFASKVSGMIRLPNVSTSAAPNLSQNPLNANAGSFSR